MAKKKSFGLGDLVEKAAKPIAKVIDKIAGTDLENCEGCKKRKEKLNKVAIIKEDKIVNNLSSEHTGILHNYFETFGSNPYLGTRQQRALIQIVEIHDSVRFKTTSCGSCWRNKMHPRLEAIAIRNGILNEDGTIRK